MARLVDRLLDGVTPGKLVPPEDVSIANSPWGGVTVEVTFDDKSNGKLDAISALRFAAEAARLSPVCALP